MASNQNRSSLENMGAASAPSLDASLAQLEEAVDLFASSPDEKQYGETHVIGEPQEKTPVVPAPSVPIAEPEPVVVAAPLKDESFEKTIQELKRRIANPQADTVPQWSGTEMLVIPREEEEQKRRFPVLTEAHKKMLLLLGVFLLFFVVVAILIWQRQKNDELRLAAERQELLRLKSMSLPPTPATAPTEEPASTTAAPSADQSLADNIKQILMAYNPSAAGTRYKVEVKDGVVTLNGEAQTQMEKDGAENVIKPLSGITKVVNNLVVKGLIPAGATVPNGPVMYPQVNPVEAKRLEEALKRDLEEGAKRAEEERQRIEQQNAQLATQRAAEETVRQEAAKQEAERLRRQQTAALQNDEDAAFRKQAEERQKQREKEEADRRAEEQRKAEAARQPEPVVRQEANSLRSGTVAWRGIVKGVDDVVIRGTSASIQHVMGGMPREPKGSFSAAMPEAPMSVRLVAASGPAPIRIIQQPSASNNFTTIVRVGEGDKADGKLHSFTLRWSAQ